MTNPIKLSLFFTLIISTVYTIDTIAYLLLHEKDREIIGPTLKSIGTLHLNKDNHSHIFALDPLLGHTFDSQKTVVHGAQIENGYVIFGEKSASTKIMTLGGSTSDVTFDENSWPKQLHDLYRSNSIDVVIYSGGVAGYSSTQEFLKLWRDVAVIKPDIIINYNGVNEIVGTSSKSSLISEYQERIFSQMGKPYQNSIIASIMPNLINLINSHSDQLNIEYGLGKELTPEAVYINNIHNMKLKSEQYNSQYIHILQPYNRSSSDLHILEIYNNFYEKIKSKLNKQPYSIDMSFFFNDQNVFLDDCHVDVRGNIQIAKFIYSHLN